MPPPPVQDPHTPDLDAAMSAADGFTAIATACLTQFERNRPLSVAAASTEAVHQSRVALRRLRAALGLFSPAVRDARFDFIKGEWKWLADALGAARDLDVLVEEFLAPEAAKAESPPGAPALVAAIEARRAAAHARLELALRSVRAREIPRATRIWCARGAWRRARGRRAITARNTPICDFLARRIGKRRKRFAGLVERFETLDPAGLHRLRIEAKKLRYAAEFCAALAREAGTEKRLQRFLAALQKTQTALGAIQDATSRAAVLEETARSQHPNTKHDMVAYAARRFAGPASDHDALLRKALKQARRALAEKSFLDGF